MTGDANTDYNAAIALVKDASRQDDAMVAFQNFVKKYPGFNLPAQTLTTGSGS
ncbi:tol-pal system protein YbgF [Klebsiella pneumoniae]|uniref:Tol-pal system protein YbgF n=1 Tax=Klebsiella pneumoniae TaxID=573 RepID=A0A377W7C4_KLEPN|nr:tol-pal system protein YbgF [Klebsiella pneumoniae]